MSGTSSEATPTSPDQSMVSLGATTSFPETVMGSTLPGEPATPRVVSMVLALRDGSPSACAGAVATAPTATVHDARAMPARAAQRLEKGSIFILVIGETDGGSVANRELHRCPEAMTVGAICTTVWRMHPRGMLRCCDAERLRAARQAGRHRGLGGWRYGARLPVRGSQGLPCRPRTGR